MPNLTFTEYTNIIDDDLKHINFLSKGIGYTTIEKYICRLIYGLDPDVIDVKEVIKRVNVLIDDLPLVTRIVTKFKHEVKEGFVQIGGTNNFMTSNGLIVTWNYRMVDVMLDKYTGAVMFKIVSEAPDNNIAFKTISDIRELHNEYKLFLMENTVDEPITEDIKYPAGIGSRETPNDILAIMNKVAIVLERDGWVLRSGGASGADEAFASSVRNKVIYLPWKNFNGIKDNVIVPTNGYIIAEELHPAWDKCSEGAKKLHSRNVNQILGNDLKTPVEMVICWTKNGKEVGGTATAVRLAKSKGIKVLNLAIDKYLQEVLQVIDN